MRKSFLLLLILSLGACAAPKVVPPLVPEAAVLLQKLVAGRERWQQLDAAAKVSFTRSGRNLSTRQFMLLEKPDRLRVDVLSLFNQLALQLTVADGELEIFLNTKVAGQYHRGPASDELLARFTRVPLRASELVSLLLHAPPLGDSSVMRVASAGERYRLTLDSGARSQQFLFDANLELRRAVYLQGEKVQLAVDYDRIDNSDHFPRRVQIEMPQQEIKVSILFSDLKLNQPVKSGRFDLKPPANAVPLQLPGLKPPEERS